MRQGPSLAILELRANDSRDTYLRNSNIEDVPLYAGKRFAALLSATKENAKERVQMAHEFTARDSAKESLCTGRIHLLLGR